MRGIQGNVLQAWSYQLSYRSYKQKPHPCLRCQLLPYSSRIAQHLLKIGHQFHLQLFRALHKMEELLPTFQHLVPPARSTLTWPAHTAVSSPSSCPGHSGNTSRNSKLQLSLELRTLYSYQINFSYFLAHGKHLINTGEETKSTAHISLSQVQQFSECGLKATRRS